MKGNGEKQITFGTIEEIGLAKGAFRKTRGADDPASQWPQIISQ